MRSRSGPDRTSSVERPVRYKLQIPFIFYWNDGIEHAAGGFTIDLTLDRAMILSCKCPPIGADVRIEVLLPSPDKSGEELSIECISKVIRVAEQPECNAFEVHGIFDDDHLARLADVVTGTTSV